MVDLEIVLGSFYSDIPGSTTFSITTFSMNDTPQNGTHVSSAIILSVAFHSCYAECRNVQCLGTLFPVIS